MATFAIGDIHGCFETLKLLLDRLPLKPSRDRLWLVGDLVNRGPRSLEVLRWASSLQEHMGDRLTVVLGNHDLHLLAVAQGISPIRKGDTLEDVLGAPDAPELLAWLRQRPLFHRENRCLLLHAGLLPQWTPEDAEGLARELERTLQREGISWLLDRKATLRQPKRARLRAALESLTRLRTCTAKGEPCSFAGPPADAPERCLPWFEVPGRRSQDFTIVCGHWAALGLRIQPGLIALDSGVVWGHSLSAIRLDDGEIFQQPAVESRKRG